MSLSLSHERVTNAKDLTKVRIISGKDMNSARALISLSNRSEILARYKPA
jgi:hypothetical protein